MDSLMITYNGHDLAMTVEYDPGDAGVMSGSWDRAVEPTPSEVIVYGCVTSSGREIWARLDSRFPLIADAIKDLALDAIEGELHETF